MTVYNHWILLKYQLRVNNQFSYFQKVVLACCILYNLRVMDGEEPGTELYTLNLLMLRFGADITANSLASCINNVKYHL